VTSATPSMKLRRPSQARCCAAKRPKPSLSRAYGVSCRARAERAALQTLLVRFAPGRPAPFWFPRSLAAGPRGIRQVHWPRQYIEVGGGVHIRSKQIANNPHAGEKSAVAACSPLAPRSTIIVGPRAPVRARFFRSR
jgi:hypothetical protein